MVSMLGDVVDRGTGALARRLDVRFAVGGKTGFTNDLKDGDHIPDRLCTVHRGSVRQRLARTVQGWGADIGRRVRGIFR